MLTILPSVGIYPMMDSMGSMDGEPRLGRMVSLAMLRRLIRFQGCGQTDNNPIPRQIILTRLARLTRMTRMPRHARVTRAPGRNRLPRLTSIATMTWQTILTWLNRMAGPTRMARIS